MGCLKGSHALAPQVGAETFRLCRGLLDGVVLVDNAAISAAIKDVFNETRSILEPAGAVAVAGAKAYLAREGLQARPMPSLPGSRAAAVPALVQASAASWT